MQVAGEVPPSKSTHRPKAKEAQSADFGLPTIGMLILLNHKFPLILGLPVWNWAWMAEQPSCSQLRLLHSSPSPAAPPFHLLHF